MTQRPAHPDGINFSTSAQRWSVHRVEVRGCSNGSGRTKEAALIDWRRDVNERRARGEEVPPAPMISTGAS